MTAIITILIILTIAVVLNGKLMTLMEKDFQKLKKEDKK